jgi:hypothetical protein
MRIRSAMMVLGLTLSASVSVFAQTLCTEAAGGCTGTFTLMTTAGGTIQVTAASDGESAFHPFGAVPDSSDGIQFVLAGGATVTNKNPVWVATATPNTFVLPAAIPFCGFENEPKCEPIGDFVFNAPLTTSGQFVILRADGTVSDFIVFGNTGPGGVGEIKFFSDPLPTMLVRYASNLTVADSVINITNSGDSATSVLPAGQTVAQNNIDGNICVNIYAFAADEQEVACCSCLVTPNALWSASVKTALLNSTLTPSFPNEVVIKMISTVPITGTAGQTCNAATVSLTQTTYGARAWGTTVHGVPTATGPKFSVSETPFLDATLSLAELTRDVQECQFIQILGSGQFGICKGCTNAGLGAAAQ